MFLLYNFHMHLKVGYFDFTNRYIICLCTCTRATEGLRGGASEGFKERAGGGKDFNIVNSSDSLAVRVMNFGIVLRFFGTPRAPIYSRSIGRLYIMCVTF